MTEMRTDRANERKRSERDTRCLCRGFSEGIEVFSCYRCGKAVPIEADACPECGIRYVKEEIQEFIENIQSDQSARRTTPMIFLDTEEITMAYFDVDENGLISSDDSRERKSIPCACTYCGTSLELENEPCPLCGSPSIREIDSMARIIADARIGSELRDQIDADILCPVCGEQGKLKDGRCTGCNTQLIASEDDPTDRILPLVPIESTVFVHLNVETGGVRFIRRMFGRRSTDQASMKFGRTTNSANLSDSNDVGKA